MGRTRGSLEEWHGALVSHYNRTYVIDCDLSAETFKLVDMLTHEPVTFEGPALGVINKHVGQGDWRVLEPTRRQDPQSDDAPRHS